MLRGLPLFDTANESESVEELDYKAHGDRRRSEEMKISSFTSFGTY